LILAVFGLGLISAFLQHGFLPGGDRPFPLAGVRVPIWHLFWLGFWTGYTMGVVGEAAGIFALPYSISVLQFSNTHVSPTTQLLTFLNPFGALLGFRRERQWNFDLALWVCLGGILGGFIGPFLRVLLLADPRPFKALVGLTLGFMGCHLCYEATPRFLATAARQRALNAKFAEAAEARRAAGLTPSGLPEYVRVATLEKSSWHLTIGFWGETWRLSVPLLFLVGFGVGVVASTLGVGGGFLLVPIFATLYHLPMYVLVAATIPYVITLSAVGLVTYSVVVPALTGAVSQPEWAWGFFAASGGILGSWCAAKTQKFVPERFLKLMLGGVTGMAGFLYVLDYFVRLPFKF
jgi:uncharacterized membrane protein YfcA